MKSFFEKLIVFLVNEYFFWKVNNFFLEKWIVILSVCINLYLKISRFIKIE